MQLKLVSIMITDYADILCYDSDGSFDETPTRNLIPNSYINHCFDKYFAKPDAYFSLKLIQKHQRVQKQSLYYREAYVGSFNRSDCSETCSRILYAGANMGRNGRVNYPDRRGIKFHSKNRNNWKTHTLLQIIPKNGSNHKECVFFVELYLLIHLKLSRGYKSVMGSYFCKDADLLCRNYKISDSLKYYVHLFRKMKQQLQVYVCCFTLVYPHSLIL